MNFRSIHYSWTYNDQEFSVDPMSTIPEHVDPNTPVFWTVVSGMTEAEAQQIVTDHKWAEVRRIRNIKIAETDWWANSDLIMTEEQTVYRQRLRDITDEFSSVESVEWPTLGQEVWPTPPFQPGT